MMQLIKNKVKSEEGNMDMMKQTVLLDIRTSQQLTFYLRQKGETFDKYKLMSAFLTQLDDAIEGGARDGRERDVLLLEFSKLLSGSKIVEPLKRNPSIKKKVPYVLPHAEEVSGFQQEF